AGGRPMGGGLRASKGNLAPHPPPFVRDAPARGRRRSPHRPGAAGPREPGHHPDLHAPVGRGAARRVPIGPSALDAAVEPQRGAAGALSAALSPVFQRYRAKADEAEAWRLASSVINLVVIALSAFSLLMAIFAPWIVPLITPGFDAPTTELTIRMTRIMLLSPVFIGMGAVVSGILNSYERFAVPAIAPLLYNLAIIAAAIVLAPLIGVEGLAVGVAVGSLAHLLI